jgi:hypothetical protein
MSTGTLEGRVLFGIVAPDFCAQLSPVRSVTPFREPLVSQCRRDKLRHKGASCCQSRHASWSMRSTFRPWDAPSLSSTK